MQVLMLTKDNFWCDLAKDFVIKAFGEENVKIFSSNVKYQKIPEEILEEKGDLLISFLSPWIIPGALLKKFKTAINFHPGPPEYPGTGCYNFALYEGSEEYGVTCHFITEKVDAGPIIKVIRFPIYSFDTVKSLRDRTLSYLVVLFYEIMSLILKGQKLTPSGECWKREAFTRKDLEELCRIDPCMSSKEISRRIRAVTYPGMPGAFTIIGGFKFEYKPDVDK